MQKDVTWRSGSMPLVPSAVATLCVIGGTCQTNDRCLKLNRGLLEISL